MNDHCSPASLPPAPQQRRSTTRPDATPTVKETIAVDSNRLLIHRLETEFLRLLLRNPIC
jgi:hypothetical protein